MAIALFNKKRVDIVDALREGKINPESVKGRKHEIFLSHYQLLNSKNRFASTPSISGLFFIQFKIRHPSVSPVGAVQLM